VAVPELKKRRKPRTAETPITVHRRDGGTDLVQIGALTGSLIFENVTYSVHTVLASKTRSGAKRMTGADRGRTRSSGPSRQTQKRDNGDNWFAQFANAVHEVGDYDDMFDDLQRDHGDL